MNWMLENFEDLDSPSTYAVDPSGVYDWLERMDSLLEDGRKQFFERDRPVINTGSEIREVIIAGMGGSAISGDMAYAVVAWSLPVPLRVIRGYLLPASIGPNTLLIVVSYSGNTEEAVWAFTQGHNRGAKIVAISTGGALEDLSNRYSIPIVKMNCNYPAPRLALGHLLPAVLAVLDSVFDGLEFVNDAISDASQALKRGLNRYSRDLPFDKNFAKKLAYDMHNAWPVIVASEITRPVAMRFAAQLNENSKWPAHASILPEMNHNEIVAYAQEGPATKKTGVLFLKDKDDHPRVQFRQDFTADMVEKNVAWVHTLKGEGKNLLSRLMSMLQTADFTSYYLAVARGLDPLTIHAIDTLKERLGKLA